MQIKIILIGKTDKSYLAEGIHEYEKRLKKYLKVELLVFRDIKNKNLSKHQLKIIEGEQILKKTGRSDYIILLDENGKEKTSSQFARFLQDKMNLSIKTLVFIIGGPYGFSDDIYKKAKEMISLSKMTFSHQMVRLIFMEQLYRANTILKGEPYHHE